MQAFANPLPGSLATTRTGLAPAGDDEHTKSVYVTTCVLLLGFRFQGVLPEAVEMKN